MAKQQPLSPEKYITTKARSLPIYKCYASGGWEEGGMVSVVVMRKHVNNNVTLGLYLVDLLCLGVKDTFYAFNITEEEAMERFIEPMFEVEETSYDVAHNIVYAGVDYALEFDIKPHKDFNITKFILEADTDKIPVIEITVGDENGNPSLIVFPTYNYGPVLQKLKQHAGEGNYSFTIQDERTFDDIDDDFDEDDFDEDDESEEDEDIVPIDFHVVSGMDTEELEEILEEQSANFAEQIVIRTELLLRELNETERGVLLDFDDLKETKDYRLFEKRKEQWEDTEGDTNATISKLFPSLRAIGMNLNALSDEELMTEALKILDEYVSKDIVAYAVVNSIPLGTILSQFKRLEDNFEKYLPAVQIFIATHAALRFKEPQEKYQFLLNAATVEMAYPFNRNVHAFHHRLFWFLKAVHAIQNNNKEQIIYYHNLLRETGTGGDLKSIYANLLENWLRKYMGIEDEEDDNLDFEMVDDDETPNP